MATYSRNERVISRYSDPGTNTSGFGPVGVTPTRVKITVKVWPYHRRAKKLFKVARVFIDVVSYVGKR